MIAYAIQAAQKSELFRKIVVSTDDAEVSEVSQKHGAEVPFLRPAELADDHTPTVPVVAHAIRELESRGDKYDYVCCIYPCVPFLDCENLINALSLLRQGRVDYCFPVGEYQSAIQRALKIDRAGQLVPFFPEFELTRTQDLERAYYDAGQFYWGIKVAWLNNAHVHSSALGLPIPPQQAVDIDTLQDWERAEVLLRTTQEIPKSA